jgi:ribose/xylose/arabinose/galactoside ABC-type transport system permease subunit
VLLIVTIRNGLTLLGVNPFVQQTVVGSIIIAAAILGQFNSKRQI